MALLGWAPCVAEAGGGGQVPSHRRIDRATAGLSVGLWGLVGIGTWCWGLKSPLHPLGGCKAPADAAGPSVPNQHKGAAAAAAADDPAPHAAAAHTRSESICWNE